MLWSTLVAEKELLFTTAKSTVGNFIFNWLDLSDCWELSVDTSNYDDINQIDIETYNAPRTDGWWILWYFVRWKSINVKLVIIEDTEDELNDMIDYLKLKLFKQEWILKININNKYRTVKASLTSINFNRDFEKTTILANVEISFRAMENFQDEDPTSYTDTSVTSNDFYLDINNTWARTDWQLYMIFSSAWVWTNNIQIEQDWYTLEINKTINSWDILVIDWIEKQVLYNWVAIDYDWPFVQLQNWSNQINIKINWTFVVDVTHLYYVNYL